MWDYLGQERPPFAVPPGPGQESVWDYPRPPELRASNRHVLVRYGDFILADSMSTIRILETASPPTYYIPAVDVHSEYLVAAAGSSFCEWKGAARYWSLQTGTLSAPEIAWSYPDPTVRFRTIAGYFSFYPGKVACYVNEERVRPQRGGFYGGWVTRDIAGPYKGEPGTSHW